MKREADGADTESPTANTKRARTSKQPVAEAGTSSHPFKIEDDD